LTRCGCGPSDCQYVSRFPSRSCSTPSELSTSEARRLVTTVAAKGSAHLLDAVAGLGSGERPDRLVLVPDLAAGPSRWQRPALRLRHRAALCEASPPPPFRRLACNRTYWGIDSARARPLPVRPPSRGAGLAHRGRAARVESAPPPAPRPPPPPPPLAGACWLAADPPVVRQGGASGSPRPKRNGHGARGPGWGFAAPMGACLACSSYLLARLRLQICPAQKYSGSRPYV
jgi:hypothetical protein